jgi:GNAT superfamily N-acetyltransferase
MFALTREAIDNIVFWMEDQNGLFVINARTGDVLSIDDEDENGVPEDDYVDLPEWEPTDGFGLMENFTASLKNPPAQKKLAAALNRGRGVFRAFKDSIAEFPEVEKKWFAYKEKELEKAVRVWYAGLCEEHGIQKIGEEPEETEELVKEDFQFLVEKEKKRVKIIARNALDKQAGKLFAKIGGGRLDVEELFVEETFRGLGLGEELLKKLLTEYEDATVTIDVPIESEAFSRVLLRENFTPQLTRFERKGAPEKDGLSHGD